MKKKLPERRVELGPRRAHPIRQSPPKGRSKAPHSPPSSPQAADNTAAKAAKRDGSSPAAEIASRRRALSATSSIAEANSKNSDPKTALCTSPMLETLRHIRNFSASHQSKRPFPSIQELRQSLVTCRRRSQRSLRQRPAANQRQRSKSLAPPRRGTASRQAVRTAAHQNPSKRSQKRLPFRRDKPTGKPHVNRSDIGNRAIQERAHAVRQVFGKKTRRHLLEKAGSGIGMKERPSQTRIPQSAVERGQVASEKPRRPDPSLLGSGRRFIPNPRKSHARALRKKRLGRIVRNTRKA